jgi:hypothetical protein
MQRSRLRPTRGILQPMIVRPYTAIVCGICHIVNSEKIVVIAGVSKRRLEIDRANRPTRPDQREK